MSTTKYEPHFYGNVQGVVIGDKNTVTIIFQSGEQTVVPFLAPPKPPYSLVGRESLLSDLKNRLFATDNLALCALNGLPGVGKTALCVFLSNDHEVLAHFQDGILWVGLGREPDILPLLGKWGVALGIPSDEISKLTTVGDRVDRIHSAIGLRKMLLVADDAWRVEDALTFRLGGPNCSHIVTTRFPEIALRFAGNETQVVHELNTVDGLELLRQLAPQVVEAEQNDAWELVRIVGGLPLALVLMGNYLRIKTFRGQSRQIHQALDKLKQVQERLKLAEPQSPVQRHPSLPENAWVSLEAIIAISDEALDEASRLALREMSVFPPKPNTFPEEAALAVISTRPTESLDRLCDFGLLENSRPERYTLHQAISDYARLKFTDQTAYERMVNFFTDFVEVHQADYNALDLETENILAAFQTAFDYGNQNALVRGATAIYEFLSARGLYALAETHLNRAKQAAISLDDTIGLAITLNNLGRVAANRGDYKQAEALYKETLVLSREVGDKEKLATVLANLGTLALNRAEYEQGETYYQEGLTIAYQLEEPNRISALLMGLGAIADSLSDYTKAEKYYQESLIIAREIGLTERMSVLLSNLGGVATVRGNYKQAEVYLLEGLDLARKNGHQENISLLLTNLGQLTHLRKDYEQAEKFYRESIIIARKIGHRKREGVSLVNLGALLGEQGDVEQSKKYLLDGMFLFRELGQRWFVSSTLVQLGELYSEQQDWDAASVTFKEALEIAKELNSQEFVADALYGLAKVAAAQDKQEEAHRLGQESLNLYTSISHKNITEVQQWLAEL